MIYRREEYIEEAGEDAKFPVKHIEALVPTDGGKTRYVGQVTLGLSTPMGLQHVPVTFEIEANTVEDAFGQFDAIADVKIEDARKGIEEEFKKLRDQASSRIVRPDEIGMGGGGGFGAGGAGDIDFSKLKQ